jgi:hypothetical protein
MERGAYWAKTCFSLGFCDGFFSPKSELNMVVMRELLLGAVTIIAAKPSSRGIEDPLA